jgi:hypothetical protein
MTEYEASRTLVKSPPELWAELSDQVSLAGHLAEPFGEIRITRLEPETAVAWEGERASGTVRIEPSGWGTRVTLTARAVQGDPPVVEVPEPGLPPPEPLPRPAPAPEPLPPAARQPSPPAAVEAPRRGLLARLRGLFGGSEAPALLDELAAQPAPAPAPAPESELEPAREPEPAPEPEPESELEPEAPESIAPPAAGTASTVDPDVVLVGVLDKLGAAHHRPFSRG